MKTILIFLMLLIAVPFAMAEDVPYQIIKINQCVNVSINVTGLSPIHADEYYFPFCNETKLNQWKCQCADDYTLFLKTKENAINVYKMNITYFTFFYNAEGNPVTSGHHISLSSRYLASLTSTTTTSTTTTTDTTTTTVPPQSESNTTPIYNWEDHKQNQSLANETYNNITNQNAKPISFKISDWNWGLILAGIGVMGLIWYLFGRDENI